MDNKTIKKIINTYLKELKHNNVDYEKVFLFGSYAKNAANENSDIDLALVFNSIDEKFKLRLKLMKLRRNIDLRIEPHPFESSSFNLNDPVASEILKYGIEIN